MIKLKQLLEGTCGYGVGGKLGEKPAGPHLMKKIKAISKDKKKKKTDKEMLKSVSENTCIHCGNIMDENLKQWFEAGVTCVGMGSKLISKAILETQNFDALEKNTAKTIATIGKLKAK